MTLPAIFFGVVQFSIGFFMTIAAYSNLRYSLSRGFDVRAKEDQKDLRWALVVLALSPLSIVAVPLAVLAGLGYLFYKVVKAAIEPVE